MTKINEPPSDRRLALVERQRRFEWQLAREIQTEVAARFVSGKTHDMLNLVQIVQLAVHELARRTPADAHEFLDDLRKASVDAQHQLGELMALARPDPVIEAGAPVGAAITAAVETVRAAAISVDLHLTVAPDTVTRCTGAELEHLVIGLALDAAAGPIELFVRERTIDRVPWLELLRGADAPIEGEHFDLRAVEAICARRGGELSQGERRGGGSELVVALPLVP